MLTSGISFRRLMVPYLISAIILGLFSVFLSNILIPPANKKRLDFEATYVKNPATFRDRNIHMQIRPGVFIFLESFNDRTNLGWRFTMEHITEGELVYKMTADNVRWDSISGNWTIENYHVRTINRLQEELSFGNRLDTVLPFTPRDFVQNLKEMETMNFTELSDYISNERLKGSENVKFYEVEMHRRLAFPFSTLVLTLIGVSLSSRKVRGGVGLHLGSGLALSFAFIMFMQISTTFATKGNLHPMLSVWIPNIFFGLIGLYLYKTTPK
jgi:lipopolysaccharide export system permease protein